MKICKIIFDIAIYIMIGILLLYLCLVIYQKTIIKKDLISINNYYLFQIASSSMETDLHIGDYIIVKKSAAYKVGDVVTFNDDGIYITHRIHLVDGSKVITKGDANLALDDPIVQEDILGKVVCKATLLSFVVKYKVFFISLIIASFIIDIVFKSDCKKNNK